MVSLTFEGFCCGLYSGATYIRERLIFIYFLFKFYWCYDQQISTLISYAVLMRRQVFLIIYLPSTQVLPIYLVLTQSQLTVRPIFQLSSQIQYNILLFTCDLYSGATYIIGFKNLLRPIFGSDLYSGATYTRRNTVVLYEIFFKKLVQVI